MTAAPATMPDARPDAHGERPVIGIVLGLLRQFRGRAVAVLALIFATALLEGVTVGMFLPLVASITGDLAADGGGAVALFAALVAKVPEDARLAVFGLIFIAILLLKGAAMVAQANASYRFIYAIRAHWVDRILRTYLAGSLLFMRTRSQGELVNDLVQETFRSVRAIHDALNLASRALTIVLVVLVMLLVDWRITLLAAAVGTVGYLSVGGIIRRGSERLGRRMLHYNRCISGDAMQALSGLREIKLYGVQDRTMARFNAHVRESHQVQTLVHTLTQVPSAVAEVLLGVILIAVLAFVTIGLGVRPVDYLPQIGVFALAGIRVASNLSFLVQKRLHFGTFVASIRAIHGMIDSATVPAESGFGSARPGGIGSGIRFRNVAFSYSPERRILDGLDLDIAAGQVTALVGPSGSGKSTIVDLLAGFYVPEAGSIEVDGRPLADLDLQHWRHAIGYISQEPFLFATTIRDNIVLGAPGIDDAALAAAAAAAHADGFIAGLADGFDTELGEGGFGLSVGQRQRIAVARAIVRRPALYIFDESTSGLDPEAAAAIEQTMRALAREATVILITHRESTAAIADRVYHIRDGRAA